MQKQRCVISLGIPAYGSSQNKPKASFQDFSRGLKRIEQRLHDLNFDGDFIYWDRHYPKGSPTVEQAGRACKPFCFDEVRSKGYT